MIYRFSDSVHCAYASWYDVHSVSSVYTTIDLLLYTYKYIHKTVTSPLAWCIFKYGIRWKLKIYAPNYSLQIFCTLPIAAKTATYLFLTNFAVEKTNINLIQCETCSECDQMWISGDFGFFFFTFISFYLVRWGISVCVHRYQFAVNERKVEIFIGNSIHSIRWLRLSPPNIVGGRFRRERSAQRGKIVCAKKNIKQ